ncbi:MAG: carboxyltransferase domain-containing protein [Boseongicola sp.]|nr:carboxyltransferase domain-containing protein [Boseongicola sp.]MDD9979248.1 carboxyltransferase domain-containing protein [Boseongicola sp.]
MSSFGDHIEPEFCPLGADGILVRFSRVISDQANRLAVTMRNQIETKTIAGVVETAASLTSVFVRFRPDQTTRSDVEAALRQLIEDWANIENETGTLRRWTIPVSFGGDNGPDLSSVASDVGIAEDAVADEVCDTSLRVLALGFAPGQPYLGFLPDKWNIPRQSGVTAEVPAGAVVVAVRQIIPFANPSPTGWRQIGRTAFRCFDTERLQPILLQAGDEVQFVPTSADQLQSLETAPDGLGGAICEIVS